MNERPLKRPFCMPWTLFPYQLSRHRLEPVRHAQGRVFRVCSRRSPLPYSEGFRIPPIQGISTVKTTEVTDLTRLKRAMAIFLLMVTTSTSGILMASEEGRRNTRNALGAATGVMILKGKTGPAVVGAAGTYIAQRRLDQAIRARHRREALRRRRAIRRAYRHGYRHGYRYGYRRGYHIGRYHRHRYHRHYRSVRRYRTR